MDARAKRARPVYLAEGAQHLSRRVLRYGLVDSEPKTLEEIGRRLGLTRERVRQVEVESLRRLSKVQEMERL